MPYFRSEISGCRAHIPAAEHLLRAVVTFASWALSKQCFSLVASKESIAGEDRWLYLRSNQHFNLNFVLNHEGRCRRLGRFWSCCDLGELQRRVQARAYLLQLLNEHSDHEVHLYEADSRVGGHAHTVRFCKPGSNDKKSVDVDTYVGSSN